MPYRFFLQLHWSDSVHALRGRLVCVIHALVGVHDMSHRVFVSNDWIVGGGDLCRWHVVGIERHCELHGMSRGQLFKCHGLVQRELHGLPARFILCHHGPDDVCAVRRRFVFGVLGRLGVLDVPCGELLCDDWFECIEPVRGRDVWPVSWRSQLHVLFCRCLFPLWSGQLLCLSRWQLFECHGRFDLQLHGMCGWLCLPDYWFVLWLELQRRDVCRVRRLGVHFVSRWLLLSFGGSERADHLCCWLFLGRWRIRLPPCRT